MENLYMDFSIVRMASVFNIHRGGYYKWTKHPRTKRELKNIEMTKMIKKIFFEYIEVFYNRKRRHSYLGLDSPQVFEDRYNEKSYENAA